MRDENKTNSSDCNAECRICNMHYRNIYTHGVNGFYKKPSVSINRFLYPWGYCEIILDKNFAQMKEEEEETADTEENSEDSQETEEETSEAEPTTEEEPEENVEI